MLAAAIARLAEAMRVMDANQADRDEVLRDHDASVQEHEARMRAYEAQIQESDARMRELRVSTRTAFERIEANNVRLREIIALLTEMQLDIARLDAAS